MTATIKTVLLNYAVCALVGGVLEYIAPEKTKKTLRITIVSVMLSMVISPIVKSEVNLENLLPEEDPDYQNQWSWQIPESVQVQRSDNGT